MDPKKQGIEFNSVTSRYDVYFDGEIIHRSKTREAAEKTLKRMTEMSKEEEVLTAQASTPVNPTSHDPFANSKQFEKMEFDIDAVKTKTGLDMTGLIPKKDGTYVPFGNYGDVERILKTGLFYPAYISGPSGNGKSTMVEQICAKHAKPCVRINLNMMVDEEVLIGSKTLKSGDVEIVEGPVLIAMRTGAVLLLDEIDAGSANTLLCLQPILEGKPYYFKLKNELITPAPGFNIIATANTKGKGSSDGRFVGTNVLNEAFLERFAVTFNQDYPSASIESKIVTKLFDSFGITDEEFAGTLTKWADNVRKTFNDGAIDETITTRRIAHIVRAYAVFRDKRKAVELCCNRFDDSTKNAFLDLFDKVSPVAAPVARAPRSNKEMTF